MSKDFEDLANQAKKAAKNMAEKSAEEIKEKFSAFNDLEQIEGLKEAASELAEEAVVFVKKYPVQSLLGAAAAGFLLGAFISRKR